MTNLMVKYSEISRHLEEKNRLLAKSESSLLEAEKIAMICHWALDMSTRSVLWSETINQILERDSSQTLDYEAYMEKIHPDDVDMVRYAHQKLLETVEPQERSYRLLMKDGRIKWVLVKATPNDSGENSSWSHGTIQDVTDMKLIEEKLQKYSNHLEEIVTEKVQEISESQMATIFALVKLSESRDDDTGAHIERTSNFCRLIAERLRVLPRFEDILDETYVNNIYNASPLHDIGKVGIPDAILLKPGKLTQAEFEIMKTHAMLGFETLSHVQKRYTQNSFLKIGMEIAKSHHEKWDGTGYPEGLSGEEIPLSARIMALADVYDALRSKRVYKEAFSHEDSCVIIEEGDGKHFDPLLAKIFRENHYAFQEIHDEQARTHLEASAE